MPLVKIDPFGVVKDVNPHDVDGVWTDVQNMRFANKSAATMPGEVLGATTTADPTHLLFSGQHANPFWVYMGDGIIHATTYVADTDIDTGNSVSSGENWDASLFNLIPIMNNTVDAPWTTNIADIAQVVTLPNFPVNTICQSIKPYRDFLIAMNITESGNEQPNRLIWSAISDAGALPPSWDITDPGTLAGDAYLTQTPGEIIDGLQLRDFFVIYKTHSMMLMRFTGGQFVMSIATSQVNSGILAKNCVVEFHAKHFILSDGDVHTYDGQTLTSVAEDRVRDEIFNNMDKTHYANSYVTHFDKRDEIWVCYPETGQEWASRAAIWNYTDDSWTFKDIGEARHIAKGLTNFAPSPTYESFAGSPDQTYTGAGAGLQYDVDSENPTNDAVAKATSFAIHNMDETFDNVGVAIPTKLEKISMDFGDHETIKFVSKIIPRITADTGVKIFIRVGTQQFADDTVFWHEEQTFCVGVDCEVSTLAKGRYISVRLRTQEVNVPWKFHGISFDIKESGRF